VESTPADPSGLPLPEPGHAAPGGSAKPVVVQCPHCGADLQITPQPEPQLLACWKCLQDVVIPADKAHENGHTPHGREPAFVVDDGDAEARRRAEEELSALHIQKIAQQRRSAYRTHSWTLIGAALLAVGAGQMAWLAAGRARAGLLWDVRTIAFAGLVPVCLMLALNLYVKSRRILAEIAALRAAEEPTSPPAFDTLSDGSQRYRNLENLQ
jgi:hypothetical protein